MRFWRIVFWSAALLNWLTGLALIFDVSAPAEALGIEMARYDPLYSPFVGWLVMVFGVMYAIVARDTGSNHVAILGGALAKAGMFALVWLGVTRGEAPFSMGLLVIAHLFFAILFLAFLMMHLYQSTRITQSH